MIFISYRKEDSEDLAQLLDIRLKKAFGDEPVFLDRYGVEPGDRWRERIDSALSKAVVVLAVIGPGWLSAKDEFERRRIDLEDDVLAYELSTSLLRSVHLIPLYVKGQKPLSPRALPDRLKGLADQQGMVFDVDGTDALIAHIQQVTGLQRAEAKHPPKPWSMPD